MKTVEMMVVDHEGDDDGDDDNGHDGDQDEE